MKMHFPAYSHRPDARWEGVRYREIGLLDATLERYCEILRSAYPAGDAHFALFEAVHPDDFFSASQYDRRPQRVALECMLRDEAVHAAFSSFRVQPTSNLTPGMSVEAAPEARTLEITYQGHYQFEGLLADLLHSAGVHGGWSGTEEETRALAAACASAIRAIPVRKAWAPYYIQGAWCSFFRELAWDHTALVQFPFDARCLLICLTDSD